MNTPQEVAAELAARFNLSDQDIAERVKSTQPTIWRVRTGISKDCSASLFIALVQLRDELVRGSAEVAADAAPEPHQEAV
jgi:hypothetical protein